MIMKITLTISLGRKNYVNELDGRITDENAGNQPGEQEKLKERVEENTKEQEL